MNRAPGVLEQALAQHQAGQLDVAQALYQQLLQANPANPDALHFLGLLSCQKGDANSGIALMRRSIAAYPNAIYYNNLGNALREHGELLKAIDSYRQAVALQPDYPEAHNNLGNALREAGQPCEALESCTQALRLRPGYAQAHNNQGNALQDLGEQDAAVRAYRQALAFWPDYAEAHHNLGNVLLAQGQHEAASESYRCATTLSPTCAFMHNNLGDALQRAGQFEAAVAAFSRVVELEPASAAGYSRLGDAYQAWGGKLEAAALCYQSASELDPADVQAHHKLSLVRLRQRRAEEALVSSNKALALEHASAQLHISHGDILNTLDDADGALASYRYALSLNDELELAHNRLIFEMASRAEASAETRLADARRFGALMAARAKPFQHRRESTTVLGVPKELRPLRVGFVSGDLRQHPTGIFFESVLKHLDTARITLIAYTTIAAEDEVTARLKPCFAAWNSLVDVPDEVAAHRIFDDRIDILVDLSGHIVHNRLPLFAWRPAPVQVSWLGFFGTTGIETMDYILGDRHVLPAAEAWHFSEKTWCLPDSYLCFTPPLEHVPVRPPPMLKNGYVTFGFFGKLAKVTEEVIRVWSRVLCAAPSSRLFLKAQQLEAPEARRRTLARFAAHGVDAARVTLEGGSPRPEYLATYNQIDVTLSPFPYPGGTTTAEGLWMGVPVLALKGDRFLTHICESILHSAGLPEWIAADEEDYVARALALTAEGGREQLVALREQLREQVMHSPLCDAPRFARNLEAAFDGMWRESLMRQSA
ncbi:tetratricopeptide repeat protein [Paraburkholderia bonniea]|uniref:tetratricopeptide repeat protein n=1 Tax=Paraburkholderia bonniea TaxID=2152891 RepID=UPI0025733153|nr:tetratricopeptide repeat protein [Paraburkholderia bonniea]WJF90396.1 tetratricopeptide repeat protein [Paraburkholderia bonniea]WJF93711.1 tetratricopeptide repeat protein [Paraburkholderia bonniea]